jgi:hypothetical protein
VREHDRVLDAALPARAGAVRAWIHAPREPVAGILFVPIDRVAGTKHGAPGVTRVRGRTSDERTRDRPMVT